MSTANNTIQGNPSSLRPEFVLAMWPGATGGSFLQCRPDALRNFEGVLIDRELHGAFEPERSVSWPWKISGANPRRPWRGLFPSWRQATDLFGMFTSVCNHHSLISASVGAPFVLILLPARHDLLALVRLVTFTAAMSYLGDGCVGSYSCGCSVAGRRPSLPRGPGGEPNLYSPCGPSSPSRLP
jgi:hypothetical protein